MNWGLRPYWVKSSVHEGVRFIRRFQKLETLTLVVDFNQYYFDDMTASRGRIIKRREMSEVAAIVRAQVEQEECHDQAWQAPKIRVIIGSWQ